MIQIPSLFRVWCVSVTTGGCAGIWKDECVHMCWCGPVVQWLSYVSGVILGWCGDRQAIPFNLCPYPPSSEMILVVSWVMSHLLEVSECEVQTVSKVMAPGLQAYLGRALFGMQWSSCSIHKWIPKFST